jgi:tetratricopeptide (TPR) repeat protein
MFFDPPEDIPDDLTAEEYLDLGKWYQAERDFDKAREALKRAVNSSPGSTVGREAHYFMAQRVPVQPVPKPVMKRYDECRILARSNGRKRVEEYRAMIDECPEFEWAHNMLGTALLEQMNVQEAIQSLQKALSLNPIREQSLLTLAEAYITIMDYDSAQKYLETLEQGLAAQGPREEEPDRFSNAERLRTLSRCLQILMAIG